MVTFKVPSDPEDSSGSEPELPRPTKNDITELPREMKSDIIGVTLLLIELMSGQKLNSGQKLKSGQKLMSKQRPCIPVLLKASRALDHVRMILEEQG